ncbi:MAG TPA: DUF2461 domain-containing protein [Bacteroidota bacterium]|jgi:uncharacterized protein (TIGR02453 family)|nr:DUF2461 domain-containing protein [Bacteroidota bacterium]
MRKPLHPEIEPFPPFAGFPREGIAFLTALKKNNNREWFHRHKSEYEEYLKFPMQSFIASLTQPMANIAPEIHVDPLHAMFRIYRDTRFSKDKQPYKTHVAAVFHHRGHWEESAGYYVHIEPSSIYVGGGIYMPDSPQLKKLRHAIADRPKEFLSIVSDDAFVKQFKGFQGEKLQRIPLGFPKDHMMGEWLKYKSFYTGVEWKEDVCYTPRFVNKVMQVYKGLLPLIRFLNEALGK